MPSEFAVFLVADALLAKGERPSLRKVREAHGRRGARNGQPPRGTPVWSHA